MRPLVLSTSIQLKNKPKIHIHYDNQDQLLTRIKAHRDRNIDSLFFTGGHGDFNTKRLNELSEKTVKSVCKILKDKNINPINTLLMDPCDSAYFIPHFNDLLDKNAVVYCNLSDGRQHHVLNIFSNYQHYKTLTLGMGLFNLVSILMNQEQQAGIPGPFTYPAVYTKNNKTLYYYGEVNQNIIKHLQQKGILVVKIDNENDYLDKLLVSQLPLAEEIYSLRNRNKDWCDLTKISNRDKTLNDDDVLAKLNNLFKEHFKNKNNISTEQYVKLLFPIARRYAKKGSNPIRLLAKAACLYQLNHTSKKELNTYYYLISKTLQIEFTLNLLRSEFQSQITQLPASATKTHYQSIITQLKKSGLNYLGDSFKSDIANIINKIIDEQSAPIRQYLSKASNGEVSIAQNKKKQFIPRWLKSLLLATSLGSGFGLALKVGGGILAISFSWMAIGIGSGVVMGATLLGETLFNRLKQSGLKQYKAYSKTQIATANKNQLHAFLDGATNTYTSQIKSCFSYRDWRFMRDYYIGATAKESQEEQLISSVQKRVRIN